MIKNSRSGQLWLLSIMLISLSSCVTQESTTRMTEPTVSTKFTTTVLAEITHVDVTEEYKAMGYPDGRKVVRNSTGDIFIAYRKKYVLSDANHFHIFVAKSKDEGQTWQVLNDNAPIEHTGAFTQRVPSIAITPDDVIHVVWYGIDARNAGQNERQIKYVRSKDGGETWSDWQNIAKIDGYDHDDLWQEHPVIYVSEEATGAYSIYVAWQGKDRNYSHSQIKFTKSTDNGETWLPWINVNPDSDTTFSRPTLVADQDNRTLYMLAYATIIDLRQIVWTQSYDGAQTWTPWIPIAPGVKDQRHVSVAIDSDDYLHTVWRQQVNSVASDTPTQIYYSTYNGHLWSTPEIIGENSSAYQVFPSVTAAQDRIWVVWSETSEAPDYPKENPTTGTIYFAMKSDQGWEPRIRLRDQMRDIYPSLGRYSSMLTDTVDLTWLESTDASTSTIHYGRLRIFDNKGAYRLYIPLIVQS